MDLLKFKKPKWKHSDPNVRLAAVQEIDADDTETLSSLVLNDDDKSVRLAALARIVDLESLEKIAQQIRDADIGRIVNDKVNQLLFDSVLTTSEDPAVQKEALGKIDDIEMLARLAVEAAGPDIRLLAVSRIDDEKVLCQILEHECGKEPALAAFEKISSHSSLQYIAEKGASKKIRNLAAQKIAGEEAEPLPAMPEEINRDEELSQIAETAGRLADSQNWDLVKERFVELNQNE